MWLGKFNWTTMEFVPGGKVFHLPRDNHCNKVRGGWGLNLDAAAHAHLGGCCACGGGAAKAWAQTPERIAHRGQEVGLVLGAKGFRTFNTPLLAGQWVPLSSTVVGWYKRLLGELCAVPLRHCGSEVCEPRCRGVWGTRVSHLQSSGFLLAGSSATTTARHAPYIEPCESVPPRAHRVVLCAAACIAAALLQRRGHPVCGRHAPCAHLGQAQDSRAELPLRRQGPERARRRHPAVVESVTNRLQIGV